MATIFDDQLDFINRDPRMEEGYAIAWTAEEQEHRYTAWIPPEYIKGKRILDQGCCGAAVGGYAMAHGAAHYTGIEMNDDLHCLSTENMTKYYAGKDWQILKISAEDFLNDPKDHYDVVIAAGIIHGVTNFVDFLLKIGTVADVAIIESIHPSMPFMNDIFSKLNPHLKTDEDRAWAKSLVERLEFGYPVIEYSDTGRMILGETKGAVSNILRPLPSMAALKLIMNRLGFVEDIRPYARLKKTQPKQFGPGRRFVMAFIRKEEPKAMSFKELVETGTMETMSWADMIKDKK
jgi:hypothetical protein